MSDNRITFGFTSKGKSSVQHKQYEFVKHREYANGNIQWRCRRYQSSRCHARLTTKDNEIVAGCDPEHNHDGNTELILARQAVAEMKAKMDETSATTTAVIESVSTHLQPEVLVALPKKQSLRRTLQRKRRKLQSDLESMSSFPPPDLTGATFDIPEVFQHVILHDSGSGYDRLVMMGSNELLDEWARAKLWLADGAFKHLNELIRTCIEEYINRSHGSVIRQLKAEVNQLKKSRDEWKEIADKLRKEIALVQSTHQRTERRRSSVTRVQRRSVGCQAREKACNALNRSPGRSSASETGKVVAPATSNDSTVALAPSVLPPASSNLSTNQRLKWIHQQGIRMSNPGLVSGALKSVSLPVASELSLVPLTVRPQTVSAMPSSSTVMIDLTAEDDGRTRQQQNAIVPGGILGSIVQPGNMVIAPNSSAYLLYTPPSRPAVIKPGEVAGVAGLPTIALGSSMATGEGYHSLPSLVSINNRPGTVLQVVNMRPPPPLQSAPLRSTLPVLAPANLQRIAVSSPAVLQHPAPLPPSPINQPAPLDARQIPPKPTLKLSRVAQGIVLSWNASITVLQEEPSTYQLYAYQQGHELPSSTLWKKVGNVKALALPMACTLTQFQVGNKYHFAVRAVDRHGRVGPFSEPGSIHLEGGTT